MGSFDLSLEVRGIVSIRQNAYSAGEPDGSTSAETQDDAVALTDSDARIETLWIVVNPKKPVPALQGLVFPEGQPSIVGPAHGGVAEWEFNLSITDAKMGSIVDVMIVLADQVLHEEFIRYRNDLDTGRRIPGYLPRGRNLTSSDKIKLVVEYE